ncbi:MAG TPA: FAD-dependent oxidoreductase, partial [Gemmatimonadaceae bacterium]|nr:FAD-dependent oxidoreductase [Gemmatimonadaceae bacterium]
MGTTEVPQFQPLTQDLRANVCVIGAGIAGMTTAYLLARAGRAVVLIDDGQIGGGETSRTTAHL